MARKPKHGPQPPPLHERLGHTFRNPAQLRTALTHSSYAAEHSIPADNERLEFLGDALVGLLTADALFAQFPQQPEGVLTRLRSMLVSRKQLGAVGESLHLGPDLLLGKGEEASGGRTRHLLLANAVEAIAAAIYIDGGIEAARAFVMQHIVNPRLADLESAVTTGGAFGSAAGDYKTALQELLQSQPAGHTRPEYVTMEDRGHGADPRFRIALHVTFAGKQHSTEGLGRSKKEAQQQAARAAYEALKPAQEAQ